MAQEMSLEAPPRGSLPRWGRRIDFERFFVELVPPGARRLNVRLAQSFASISFGTDEGRSSLAGDRLRRYDRRPYEFIVVPACFPLRGESDSAPEVLALVFDFDALKPDLAPALQVGPAEIEPRVIIGGPRPFVTAVAQRIRRHMLGTTVSRDYLRSLCLLLLVEMMCQSRNPGSKDRGARLKDEVLQAILAFIDANLDADLSLDRLSAMAGLVGHRFARAFKRRVGQPPHSYVLLRRVEAARALLDGTERPIAEIAYATGFSSQSHMTTTFRRELGRTPAQLREGTAG